MDQALRLIRVDIMDLPVNNLDEDGNNGGIEGEDGMGRDMNGTDVVRREGRAKGSWEDSLNDLERVQGVMARVRSANMLGETAKLEVRRLSKHCTCCIRRPLLCGSILTALEARGSPPQQATHLHLDIFGLPRPRPGWVRAPTEDMLPLTTLTFRCS